MVVIRYCCSVFDRRELFFFFFTFDVICMRVVGWILLRVGFWGLLRRRDPLALGDFFFFFEMQKLSVTWRLFLQLFVGPDELLR